MPPTLHLQPSDISARRERPEKRSCGYEWKKIKLRELRYLALKIKSDDQHTDHKTIVLDYQTNLPPETKA